MPSQEWSTAQWIRGLPCVLSFGSHGWNRNRRKSPIKVGSKQCRYIEFSPKRSSSVSPRRQSLAHIPTTILHMPKTTRQVPFLRLRWRAAPRHRRRQSQQSRQRRREGEYRECLESARAISSADFVRKNPNVYVSLFGAKKNLARFFAMMLPCTKYYTTIILIFNRQMY